MKYLFGLILLGMLMFGCTGDGASKSDESTENSDTGFEETVEAPIAHNEQDCKAKKGCWVTLNEVGEHTPTGDTSECEVFGGSKDYGKLESDFCIPSTGGINHRCPKGPVNIGMCIPGKGGEMTWYEKECN